MIWLVWAIAYAAALITSWAMASASATGGNLIFVAGALIILASVGFLGVGGERRAKKVRDRWGMTVREEPMDPAKRRRHVSAAVKLFLLGAALWAPLLWLALR